MVDTNSDPDGIDYVIPGNDDAIRAIRLYVMGVADAIEEGRNQAALVSAEEFIEVEEEPATSAALAQAIDAEIPESPAPAVAEAEAVAMTDAVEEGPDATEQPDLPAPDETSEEEN